MTPKAAKYRRDGTDRLFSTTLVLPSAEAENLRRLHAQLLLGLVSLGGKAGRFSHASTIRAGVRYLVESCAKSSKMRAHLVESARRLQAGTGKIGSPGERINVYLLREDLPELLNLQVHLMAHNIESSRTLVLRCGVDLLGKTQKEPGSWMRIVRLAKSMLS